MLQTYDFKVEFGEVKIDRDVKGDAASSNRCQEFGDVIPVVEQVDEGVVVQWQRLQDLVSQRLDVGQRFWVDVRKSSHDIFHGWLKRLVRQERLRLIQIWDISLWT